MEEAHRVILLDCSLQLRYILSAVAKVIGSTFERKPEVGVVFGVGINSGAVGEDDLIVDDLIADETVARSEVGYSTSSDKAPYAHSCNSPSSNPDSDGIERLVDG